MPPNNTGSHDQCAVAHDGSLKDASEIIFYNDPDDPQPISALPASGTGPKGREALNRQVRNNGRFQEILRAEREGSPAKKGRQPRKKRKHPKHHEARSDEGSDYRLDSSDDGTGSEGGTESDIVEITNDEVVDSLLAKTVPSKRRRPQKKRRRQATDESRLSEETTVCPPKAPSGSGKVTNPIHLFYEPTTLNAKGELGATGDKHYRCLHGTHKVLTITAAMKGNLSGLTGYIRSTFGTTLFILYQALKARPTPPTREEIDYAMGKRPFDVDAVKKYSNEAKLIQESLLAAFSKQRAAAVDPFEQSIWEDKLLKWLVAGDHAFLEVQLPEFLDLITYTHHGCECSSDSLHIPSADAAKRKIMKMGDNVIEETREMFQKIEGKISISLDAWTSNNQHAFLAIVAHYVNNDGQLDELLIDFRELVGEHSGDNMASAVWETLETYGLLGRVLAFVMDNASNNDTMMEALESKYATIGIDFPAKRARLRCMPHTVHLAAMKLLESVGAVSQAVGRKAASQNSNYQEGVELAGAGAQAELEDLISSGGDLNDHDEDMEALTAKGISPAIAKLRKVVRHVRASPQRRQSWLEVAGLVLRAKNDLDVSRALMLILDIVTRWSSTHQMLRRATTCKKAVDHYILLHEDSLGDYSLSESDWNSITTIASWLQPFRTAVTQLSATKIPTISQCLDILRGLEEELKGILRRLPSSTSPTIKKGLLDAHAKLSEYYYKFDESPFYTWSLLLDPRTDRERLREDHLLDPSLCDHLDQSMDELKDYFSKEYTIPSQSGSAAARSRDTTPPPATIMIDGSPQKAFTSRYRRQSRVAPDELTDFLKLAPEGLEIDPIQWWISRKAQFPLLYRLALDILSIPASSVAVERIFSGGRDTISLRRYSLHPSTIRVLMLLKKKIHASRTK